MTANGVFLNLVFVKRAVAEGVVDSVSSKVPLHWRHLVSVFPPPGGLATKLRGLLPRETPYPGV